MDVQVANSKTICPQSFDAGAAKIKTLVVSFSHKWFKSLLPQDPYILGLFLSGLNGWIIL